jgi:hypothetical protein
MPATPAPDNNLWRRRFDRFVYKSNDDVLTAMPRAAHACAHSAEPSQLLRNEGQFSSRSIAIVPLLLDHTSRINWLQE